MFFWILNTLYYASPLETSSETQTLRRLPARGGQDLPWEEELSDAQQNLQVLAGARERGTGPVSSCGAALLQCLVSLDLDGSMLKLHFGLQSRLQCLSRLQGGGERKSVLEKHSSTCVYPQATYVLHRDTSFTHKQKRHASLRSQGTRPALT